MTQMLDSTISAERRYQERLERGEVQDQRHRPQAQRNVAEKLYGQQHGPIKPRQPSVHVVVDRMLDDPARFGFDGDAIDADALAAAIAKAAREWEYYHFTAPDKLPDDPAHALIFKAARVAVTEILASDYGEEQVDDEVDRLAEDDA